MDVRWVSGDIPEIWCFVASFQLSGPDLITKRAVIMVSVGQRVGNGWIIIKQLLNVLFICEGPCLFQLPKMSLIFSSFSTNQNYCPIVSKFGRILRFKSFISSTFLFQILSLCSNIDHRQTVHIPGIEQRVGGIAGDALTTGWGTIIVIEGGTRC